MKSCFSFAISNPQRVLSMSTTAPVRGVCRPFCMEVYKACSIYPTACTLVPSSQCGSASPIHHHRPRYLDNHHTSAAHAHAQDAARGSQLVLGLLDSQPTDHRKRLPTHRFLLILGPQMNRAFTISTPFPGLQFEEEQPFYVDTGWLQFGRWIVER
jgi:hypothetical protein